MFEAEGGGRREEGRGKRKEGGGKREEGGEKSEERSGERVTMAWGCDRGLGFRVYARNGTSHDGVGLRSGLRV